MFLEKIKQDGVPRLRFWRGELDVLDARRLR